MCLKRHLNSLQIYKLFFKKRSIIENYFTNYASKEQVCLIGKIAIKMVNKSYKQTISNYHNTTWNYQYHHCQISDIFHQHHNYLCNLPLQYI